MFKAIESMGAKLAKKDKIESLMSDDMYVAQIKIDGFRISAEKRNGEVKIFGRGSGKYAKRTEYTELLPHIVAALSTRIPDDTILDGEIAYLNEDGSADYNKTSNVMGSLPDRALMLQVERGPLTFQMFDALEYMGISMINDNFTSRNSLIHNIISNYKYIIPVQTVHGTAAKKKLLDSELSSGREGIMLKNIESTYIPGKKRENTWYKIKAEADADVVIIGYTEPDEFTQIMRDGRKMVDSDGNPVLTPNRYFYNGWIGSIIIGQYVELDKLSDTQIKYLNKYRGNLERQYKDNIVTYLVPVGKVSSGLADDVRAAISQSRTQNLGRVIEIKYFKRTDDSYYLPRFNRFRDEKPAIECIWGE